MVSRLASLCHRVFWTVVVEPNRTEWGPWLHMNEWIILYWECTASCGGFVCPRMGLSIVCHTVHCVWKSALLAVITLLLNMYVRYTARWLMDYTDLTVRERIHNSSLNWICKVAVFRIFMEKIVEIWWQSCFCSDCYDCSNAGGFIKRITW